MAVSERQYAQGLVRAFGGALFFAFPLLMTMEMWAFGVGMHPLRLALFLILSLPLLHGLSYYAGFRHTDGFRDDALDVLGALAVGFVTSAALLGLFGVLRSDQPVGEIAGKIALQAVPAAFGALLARKQLAGGAGRVDKDENDRRDYRSALFLMMAGALFVAFNVAPTEEMILIAFKMSAWHTLLLAMVSIGLLHAIVYLVGFAGQEDHARPVLAFLHFTVVGYALCLLVSLYVLWTFGRLDGLHLTEMVSVAVVLSFPAALGAGAARLLV